MKMIAEYWPNVCQTMNSPFQGGTSLNANTRVAYVGWGYLEKIAASAGRFNLTSILTLLKVRMYDFCKNSRESHE
jgi:hypothetical protein